MDDNTVFQCLRVYAISGRQPLPTMLVFAFSGFSLVEAIVRTIIQRLHQFDDYHSQTRNLDLMI